MKKRLLTSMLCIGLAFSLLTGCGDNADDKDRESSEKTESVDESKTVEESSEETKATEESQEASTEESKPTEESGAAESSVESSKEDPVTEVDSVSATEQAFQEFLAGKREIKFTQDSYNGFYYELERRSYDYDSLKTAVTAIEMKPGRPYYAQLDVNGTALYVLRFESIDPSFNNWNGIVRFDGKDLILTNYYEDGYRTYSELYKNGLLNVGGSFGAGAHGSTYELISEEGERNLIFDSNYYFGSFAEMVAYNLNNYDYYIPNPDIWEYSELQLSELLVNDKVYICVDEYSSDEDVKAAEMQMIADLKGLGAIEISSEEMLSMMDIEAYTGGTDFVEWTAYDDGMDYSAYVDPATVWCAMLDDDVVRDYYPNAPYVEIEDGEYAVNVIFFTTEDLDDVRVVDLTAVDVDDIYGYVCDYTVRQKTSVSYIDGLVIRMVFHGDSPTLGVVYTDVTGDIRSYGFALSGEDGRAMLVPVEIRNLEN